MLRPAVLVAGILVWSSGLASQTFDSASLKVQDASGPQSEIQVTPSSFAVRGASLRYLIQWAWDVPSLAISGSSAIDDIRYDVTARTGQPASSDQIRAMLRGLLNDRLSLQTHVEKKEKKHYALIVIPGGPKFRESTDDGPAEFTRGVNNGKTALVVRRGSMSELAAQLARKLNELIVDQTGLKGRYDLSIDITPYASKPGDLSIADNDVLTIMFASLPAQTGLKLDSSKQPVDILVVDRVGPLKGN